VLLDHEVIHWGDPAFDLGFALAHLLSKAHHLQNSQLVQAARQFVEVYALTVGPIYWDANMQAFAARHMLGCLLARVAGRSPLEYLTPQEQSRQQQIVVALMKRPAESIQQQIDWFFMGI
jgi:hypothetical protein